MSLREKDPLLTIGKMMTIILMAMTAVATVVLLVAIPVLLFKQADFAKAVIESGGENVNMAMTALVILLLVAAATASIAFHFFQLLGRIISTVGENNPFTVENADRLTRMGWIALAFQVASFPIAALVVYLAGLIPNEDLTTDFSFSFTGVLFAIVLFILARVFRHGAEMRSDLEGTV